MSKVVAILNVVEELEKLGVARRPEGQRELRFTVEDSDDLPVHVDHMGGGYVVLTAEEDGYPLQRVPLSERQWCGIFRELTGIYGPNPDAPEALAA